MSDQEAPDYGPAAAAQNAATAAAERAAAADLAWRQKVYNDNQPFVQNAQEVGLANARKQGEAADLNLARGKQLLEEDQQYGEAARARMYEDASTIGGEADQNRAAGQAVADVRSQSNLANQSLDRNLAALGINPNSGKFVALKKGASLREGALAAGSANKARETQRDKGVALRAGAANFSQGMGNSAATTYGTALSAGNSAGANAGNAADAVMPGANFVAGGYDSAMRSAGLQMDAARNLTRMAEGEVGDSGAGMINGLGNLAMGAGALGLKFSDRRLKKNIKKVGEKNGFNLYEFTYKDKADMPEGKYIGVMADEVKKIKPSAVSLNDDGFMEVDYQQLGFELRKL